MRKWNDEIQVVELDGITKLLEMGELETSKGKNQISTLKQDGDTRLSSHFYSIYSMVKLYNASFLVLQKLLLMDQLILQGVMFMDQHKNI